MVQELIDTQIPTSNSNIDLALVDADINSFGTERVNPFTFPQEHDLEFASFRVVVDVLSEGLVNEAVLDWDVY